MLWVPDLLGNHLGETQRDLEVHKLIFLCVLLAFAPHFVPWPYSWDAAILCTMIQCACMAFIGYRLTPYSKLRLKSLLAAFVAFSVLDVVLYPARFAMAPFIVYAVEVALAFIFLLFIHNKHYYHHSDSVYEDRVYLVGMKPKNIFQLIVSLFNAVPVGGIGILANGKWYHYRKKSCRLECTDVRHLNASEYHVIEFGPSSDRVLQELDSLVGSKWSAKNNCMTRLKPILDGVK